MVCFYKFIEQASEGTFLHDDIYYVEEDTHQDGAYSAIDGCFTRKGEACGEKTEADGLALRMKYDDLYGVSNRKGKCSDPESQEDVFNSFHS